MFLSLSVALAQSKIIDGTEAQADQWPEVVMVATGGTGSGVLIHPEWVLTHATVFDSTDLAQGLVASVFVGSGGASGFESFVDVDQVLIQDGYVSRFQNRNGDWVFHPTDDGTIYRESAHVLALVHLERPVTDVQPAVLHDGPIHRGWIDEQVMLTAVGFGVTSIGSPDSGTKRAGSAPITRVEAAPPKGGWLIGSDGLTCWADRGGPIYADGPGGPVVVALAAEAGCEVEDSLYARVDVDLDWVRSHVPDVATATITIDEPEPLELPAVEIGGCSTAPSWSVLSPLARR